MLTKNDLSQIKGVVKKELVTELEPIKKDIKEIKADINMVIGAFDRETLNLHARVQRIESFLKIPPLTV